MTSHNMAATVMSSQPKSHKIRECLEGHMSKVRRQIVVTEENNKYKQMGVGGKELIHTSEVLKWEFPNFDLSGIFLGETIGASPKNKHLQTNKPRRATHESLILEIHSVPSSSAPIRPSLKKPSKLYSALNT